MNFLDQSLVLQSSSQITTTFTNTHFLIASETKKASFE